MDFDEIDNFLSSLADHQSGVLLSHASPDPREAHSALVMPLGVVRQGWNASVGDADNVAVALGVLVDRAGSTRYLSITLGGTWLAARGLVGIEWLTDYLEQLVVPMHQQLFGVDIEPAQLIDDLVTAGCVRVVPGFRENPAQALRDLADCWLVPLATPQAVVPTDDGPILYTHTTIAVEDDDRMSPRYGVVEIPEHHAEILSSGVGQQLDTLRKRWSLSDTEILAALSMLVSNGIIALLPDAVAVER